MINVLEIDEKRKPHPLAMAASDNFTYREAGQVDPSVVIMDPTISLYCLDPERRRVLFVQVPEGIDITAAPFLFMEQYDRAMRVLAVPYDLFHALAAQVRIDAPLVLIYSTGRAGSTLLSRAFADMGSTTSLSEPDVYTQAAAMRLAGGDANELEELLASATKIHFNPAFTQGSSLHVIKFRSFDIEIADLLARSFPSAGNIFLYRDLKAYIHSAMRAFGLYDLPPEERGGIALWLGTVAPLLARELRERGDVDGIEICTLIWLSAVHAYLRLRSDGLPMLPVRYEQVVANPYETLTTVLSALHLPTDRVDLALRAFTKDSQAGSPLSREQATGRSAMIEAPRWELVHNLVRRYPVAGFGIPPSSVDIQGSTVGDPESV